MLRLISWLFCLTLISFPSYASSYVTGGVSYYHEGSHTSSGEPFHKEASTCAHRSLPFNTIVNVEYRGKVVQCRVNDRGPFVKGRVLDVSLGVARKLAMLGAGVINAKIYW